MIYGFISSSCKLLCLISYKTKDSVRKQMQSLWLFAAHMQERAEIGSDAWNPGQCKWPEMFSTPFHPIRATLSISSGENEKIQKTFSLWSVAKKIGERMFSLIVICGQMDGAVKRWKISFTGKECICVLTECQFPNFN